MLVNSGLMLINQRETKYNSQIKSLIEMYVPSVVEVTRLLLMVEKCG